MSNSIPSFDFFLEQFEAQFEAEKPDTLGANTNFRDLEEWSSMQALMVNLFLDETYGVTLTTEDYRHSKTVGDLYEILKARLK